MCNIIHSALITHLLCNIIWVAIAYTYSFSRTNTIVSRAAEIIVYRKTRLYVHPSIR